MSRIVQHVIFWFCFLFWSSLIVDWHNFSVNCEKSFFSNVRHIAIRLPIIIGATYFLVYHLLPKYLIEKKSVMQFGLLMVLLFLTTSLIDRTFIALMDSGTSLDADMFSATFFNHQAIIRNAMILIVVMAMATMIRFYRIHIAIEANQHKLVQDNLHNQLVFLKAQVNPHFLFNALNNIYSECVQKQELAIASNIEHLSGIMRYLTYDSNAKFVALSKEVELLKNYVDVERMRFSSSDELVVSFIAEGNFQHYVIAPVLLLPLVENVFKHGVRPEEPCFVNIKVKVEDHSLFFETRNKCITEPNKLGGVGLENVKKRLSLLYPDRHEFEYTTDQEDFILTLRVDLDAKN